MLHTLLRRAGLLGLGLGMALTNAAWAGTYNLTVDYVTIDTGEFTRTGIGYNGSAKPPVLRFQEGERTSFPPRALIVETLQQLGAAIFRQLAVDQQV